MAVVTISAPFAAGGGVVGPAVAVRLGLQFYDRAIPAAAGRQLQLPDQTALALDEQAPGRVARMAASMAALAAPLGAAADGYADADQPDRFREATEEILRGLADGGGGVILGRCAMVVLGDRPDVLCVRLDAPVEHRVARAAALEGVPQEEAADMQRRVDRSRDAYARVFYRVDQADGRLYHLSLDTSALDLATCVDVIVDAARARFARTRAARVSFLGGGRAGVGPLPGSRPRFPARLGRIPARRRLV